MQIRSILNRIQLYNGFVYGAMQLVEQGFDDIESMKLQMSSEIPITNEILKNAGILKAGHRARILV